MHLEYFHALGILAPIKGVIGLSKDMLYALGDQGAARF